MTEGVFLYSTTSLPFSQITTCTPAVSNSRGCAEQVAHPVCSFAQPRTHAAGSGCAPTHGSCFPGGEKARACGEQVARLRRASRAPAAGKSRTGFVPAPSRARTRLVPGARLRRAHLRWASRAAAPSKSRTVSFSSPRLARTRLVPGVGPHRASVFPGREKAWFLFPAAGQKPTPAVGKSRTGSFLPRVSHARAPAASKSRGCAGQVAHRVCACAQPRTHAAVSECVPTHGSCFPGGEKAPARPPRTETLEKLSFAPWLFKRFPCQPAVCGPKGRVSRPAARKRGRSAKGRRRPPLHRNA